MKVLALGNSDSLGAHVTGPIWSEVARARLEAEMSEDVTFENIPYSVTGTTAVSYAERKIAEFEPDVVVLPVASYQFTAGFTWVRVQRLFGVRAGRWYRNLEERFEKQTRGRGSLGDGLNRIARATVRRLIGTQPMATRQQVTAAYDELIGALARHEDLGVVLVTYPGRGAHAQSREAKRERAIFFPEVEAMATRHRFGWVNGETAFDRAAPGDVIHSVDRLHFNDYGHEVFGSAVADAIRGLPAHPNREVPSK